VPFAGLPARIAWIGHCERTSLALAVNRMVRDGLPSGPIAFTRDHFDAGAMAHPNIMTERMRDGSDAIADWPLLDAMAMRASQADLVAIHSGGGYSGYMTNAELIVIADGTREADERLALPMTNDTSLGVMRYADAGFPSRSRPSAAAAYGISGCKAGLISAPPATTARGGLREGSPREGPEPTP
jgi:urocanate hydratase